MEGFPPLDVATPQIPPHIVGSDGTYDNSGGPYVVAWQYTPVSELSSITNINFVGAPGLPTTFDELVNTTDVSFTEIYSNLDSNQMEREDFAYSMHRMLVESNKTTDRYKDLEPFGLVFAPVRRSLESDSSFVAIVTALFQWRSFLENALPEGSCGVDVVVQDHVGHIMSFYVNGPEVVFVGEIDAHRSKFDKQGLYHSISTWRSNETVSFTVYPSEALRRTFTTRVPLAVALSMCFIIVIVFVIFWIYDSIVEYRHDLVLEKVTKAQALIADVFPKHVVDRLVENVNHVADEAPIASISCARRGSLLGGESVHSGMSGGMMSRRGSFVSRRMSMDSVVSGMGRRRASLDSTAGAFGRRGSTGGRRMSLAQSDGTASRTDGVIADFYPEASVFCTSRT